MRTFSFNLLDWKTAIKHIKHAVSKDDNRPLLHGVRIEIYGWSMRLVALDGYVMNIANINLIETDVDCSFVIEPIIVEGKKEDKLILCLDENEKRVTIKNERTTHVHDVPLLEGEFLDWKKAIPEDQEPVIYFSAAILKAALAGIPDDKAISLCIKSELFPIAIGDNCGSFFSLALPLKTTKSWKPKTSLYDGARSS